MQAVLGEIRAFAGEYAPLDWAICDGSLLNVSGNEPLFSIIGIQFGGNGSETFGLPDLRGRVILSAGQSSAPEGSLYKTGNTGGQESVALSVANVPAHTHSITVSTANASTDKASGNLLAAPIDLSNPVNNVLIYYPDNPADATEKQSQLNNNTISYASGDSVPHENRQPYAVITYIICVNGSYPEFE